MPPIEQGRTGQEQRPQNALDEILSDRVTHVPMVKVSGDFTDRIRMVGATRMCLVLIT